MISFLTLARVRSAVTQCRGTVILTPTLSRSTVLPPEAADATSAPALSDDTIATNIPIATTDERPVTQPSCPFCSPSALLSVLGSPCVHCPNRQQLLSDHRGLVERPRASRPKARAQL